MGAEAPPEGAPHFMLQHWKTLTDLCPNSLVLVLEWARRTGGLAVGCWASGAVGEWAAGGTRILRTVLNSFPKRRKSLRNISLIRRASPPRMRGLIGVGRGGTPESALHFMLQHWKTLTALCLNSLILLLQWARRPGGWAVGCWAFGSGQQAGP